MDTPNPWKGKTPDELVPTVNPADLKAVWQLYADAEQRNPGQQVAVGLGLLQHTCSPGADATTVCYRAVMLELLYHAVGCTPEEPEAKTLAKWRRGNELDDRLFNVMAKIPLKWIPEGGMQGAPFDVAEFIKQLDTEAA
jgi:hypothetical protein